jgi:hypothetical protein
MFPDNHDIMYRTARLRSKEIRDSVEASRGDPTDAHIVWRRLAVLLGIGLIGLTLVALLALGWWVF